MINKSIQKAGQDISHYVAIADEDDVPFQTSRIITLINFGRSPTVAEYNRRVRRVFSITNDWPMGEPRGLVINVTASTLSPPYTILNMDSRDWSQCFRNPESLAWVSVFRTEHPESLHNPRTNTFEKSTELCALEQAGISFKSCGEDELQAGSNIKEWHLMLGHCSGERTYFYHTDWSWTGSPPDRFANTPTVKVNLADILHPNPYHRPACDFESLVMRGTIQIPQHLSVPGVLDFVNRQRRILSHS